MKLRVKALILILFMSILWVVSGHPHVYGHPGSPNGGVVLYSQGLELWGNPGFFVEAN